jgi:transcriptional regulator with XRE-family HTH domain
MSASRQARSALSQQRSTHPQPGERSRTAPRLSATFVAALATSDVPAYRLARAVGMSPTWLSRRIRGRRRVRVEDYERLLTIGRRLGLSPGRVFVLPGAP